MVVCCVCCHVEVSATGRSLVQRSHTDCGVSLCVISELLELIKGCKCRTEEEEILHTVIVYIYLIFNYYN